MKQVIDANYFQDPDLDRYLNSGKDHVVILSDYACMEAYKGNALKCISKSIEILSRFPDQVVILKGTREIIKLTLQSHDPGEFEDPDQTENFEIFCSGVQRALSGDSVLARQILLNGHLASKHFEKMREEAAIYAEGIRKIELSLKPEHLRVLRKKEQLPNDLIDETIKAILLTAGLMLRDHPDVPRLPEAPQLRNSYLFRYAISAYLLTLRWITEGGPGNVRLDRLRNDVVDMHYVAYATYFDGLLTRDIKMNEIYLETCFFLENVFPV